MPELFARLDKTGLHVLCSSGNRRCRGELARIFVREEDGERLLCVLDGWKQKYPDDNGRHHWLEGKHSARRRRGAEAAVRIGSLDPAQLAARSAPRRRRAIQFPDDCDRVAAQFPWGNDAIVLPADGADATCARCGHVNTLMAAHLRVATR